MPTTFQTQNIYATDQNICYYNIYITIYSYTLFSIMFCFFIVLSLKYYNVCRKIIYIIKKTVSLK